MSEEQDIPAGTGDEREQSAAADSDETAAESSDGESNGEPPLEEITEQIEDKPAEEIAEEIAALREEVDELAAERDDLESRLKRKQAEFQNYKKRQEKRREEERNRATESLVEDLLGVRDNLSRALEQGEDADIRDGVEATFRGLEDVLDGEGVEPVEPEPGAETDPNRHEVLLRVESGEPEGTVAELHRPGYEMAGKVLRPAQVTVSDGSEATEPDQSAANE